MKRNASLIHGLTDRFPQTSRLVVSCFDIRCNILVFIRLCLWKSPIQVKVKKIPLTVEVYTDTFWIFIFTLNRAEKWFNSIFNSKLNQKYSFKKIIHSNWKTNHSLRKQCKNSEKYAKGARFVQKRHFIFIFLMNSARIFFIQ